MAFPILSRGPKTVDVDFEVNEIKSKFESGYEHKRKKFTKTRKKFTVEYDILYSADKDLILAHFDEVGTYTAFTWTDMNDTEFIVFYEKAPKYVNVSGYYQFEPFDFTER